MCKGSEADADNKLAPKIEYTWVPLCATDQVVRLPPVPATAGCGSDSTNGCEIMQPV